ncbi:MAG: glycosyl hydrolase [Wenzhouxiangella sp.]|nr:MAG: glycosyl hydrolase [Wenzhouxiangella sp.]
MSATQRRSLLGRLLDEGVHGLCFSLYEQGQKPGDPVTEDQIRRRLGILKPHTRWIRSFSCTEGNEMIPQIARELGFKTLVGAWLGNEQDKNHQEIKALVQLARQELVDVAAVGNEVLYREELPEEQLLEYIGEVKKQIPDIPVGYVDAYYEFVERPSLVQACDLILCNCYPFWEGTAFEHALEHMRHMHQRTVAAAMGKTVVITETGWPSQGEVTGAARPSRHNAMEYFLQTQLWAEDNQIQMFYFSSFDEAWKVDTEGNVGAYWGVWDSKEELKY